MNLFQLGDFTLHSGLRSEFKIDCDALSDKDLRAIAFELAKLVPQFGNVLGVPTGGTRLADIMRGLSSECGTDHPLLIVDDVFTTGASMEAAKKSAGKLGYKGIMGAVIFARGPCPAWIKPLFQMTEVE